MDRIEDFYDQQPGYEWGRLERHRVEYEITLRALAEYLPPAPARVIDIGGSVGRYAIELTRRGYEVTLVDLSRKCLDFARQKAREASAELASVRHANALDLSALADASFDAALLMGPLYHLLEPAQRQQAVAEAARVLRPGTPVVARFINRWAILHYAASERPDYVTVRDREWTTIRDTGLWRRPEGEAGFIDAWFTRPQDIEPLMAPHFVPKAMLSAESVVDCLESRINATEGPLFTRWIDELYRVAKEPSILGAAGHLLYVGTKR